MLDSRSDARLEETDSRLNSRSKARLEETDSRLNSRSEARLEETDSRLNSKSEARPEETDSRLNSKSEARPEEPTQVSTRGAKLDSRSQEFGRGFGGLLLFRTSGLTIGPLSGVPSRCLGFSENNRQHTCPFQIKLTKELI